MEKQMLEFLIKDLKIDESKAKKIISECQGGSVADRKACINKEAAKILSLALETIQKRLQQFEERKSYIESLKTESEPSSTDLGF